jgi:phospholipid-binding lipoprotein MlaA
VLVNSTVGMFGLFDIATELGLEKHDEDLGQTLGSWGVSEGPYIVLPCSGQHPARQRRPDRRPARGSGVAVQQVAVRNSLTGLRFITVAALLGADTTADQAALDKYGYMRSFYLQYRLNQVYDGQPPRVKDPDDEAYMRSHAACPTTTERTTDEQDCFPACRAGPQRWHPVQRPGRRAPRRMPSSRASPTT